MRVALVFIASLASGGALAQDGPKRAAEPRRAEDGRRDEPAKDEPRKIERVCLNASETREAVAQHKLVPAAAALSAAASHVSAESLRSRLCRWNEDYVYEVTLLRKDGKVLHVFVQGANGAIVPRDERL